MVGKCIKTTSKETTKDRLPLTASLTRNICKNSDFYLMYKDLRGIKGEEAGSFSGLGLLRVERWTNVK